MKSEETNLIDVTMEITRAKSNSAESRALVNILKDRLGNKDIDCTDLVEWEENELIEYAFSCAKELARLESLAEILADSINETGFSLDVLDELVFKQSQETPEEVEEDGI